MYQLEYLEKLGRFYHRARPGFSFGTTLHQTLQIFHEAGGAAALDVQAAQQLVLDHWVSGGYTSKASEDAARAEAAQIVALYHGADVTRIDQTELFLSEKQLVWDMGEWILTGRVDRVDEHLVSGDLEVVDYKSGRMSVTSEDVSEALAMSIYQYLIKRIYPERRVFATIHALRGNVTASAELDDEQMVEFEGFLNSTVDEIRRRDFAENLPVYIPGTCEDCDFLARCRRFWNALEKQSDSDIF